MIILLPATQGCATWHAASSEVTAEFQISDHLQKQSELFAACNPNVASKVSRIGKDGSRA